MRALPLLISSVLCALITGACEASKNRGTQPRHEDKVVEVAGLERRVLTVIGEAEELSTERNDGGGTRPVHPPNDGRHQDGRSGASAFGRQSGETVDIAPCSDRIVTTARTEPELAGKEPCARSS